jgi:hypothetical protein
MLWNASALKGYAIEARDGRLGTVTDFLFDDTDWIVRWLVVDTGNWLSGRKVLLPLSALGKPDAALHQFPVKLTMQQVKDSPDIDRDRPVSRQQETHIYDYYGWDPYWGRSFLPIGGGIATPFVAPLPLSTSQPRDVIGAGSRYDDADPHLRSVEEVTGYDIHATDGEIGHVADFLVGDSGWSIRYVAIDTGNWLPGAKVLISPRSVREIDWAERVIHLDVNRQKVQSSPPYDASATVDSAYDERFLTYYGITWVSPERPQFVGDSHGRERSTASTSESTE